MMFLPGVKVIILNSEERIVGVFLCVYVYVIMVEYKGVD